MGNVEWDVLLYDFQQQKDYLYNLAQLNKWLMSHFPLSVRVIFVSEYDLNLDLENMKLNVERFLNQGLDGKFGIF